jgi:hypothetical protein
LVRFWLLKLSRTHFKDIYTNQGILNPKFLSVLNPRTGTILFHANEVYLSDSETIPADFAKFICARRIDLYTRLLDEPHRENLFKFITGTGNTLEKFHIRSRSFGANMGEFCEFLVKVNFLKFIFIIPNFI